jgi:hypothetical protein
MAVLQSMPKSMLLVLRNLNTVRSICVIHGHPVDRYTLNARVAVRGIFHRTLPYTSSIKANGSQKSPEEMVQRNQASSNSLLKRLKNYPSRVCFEWCLLVEKSTRALLIAYLKLLYFFGQISNLDTIVELLS